MHPLNGGSDFSAQETDRQERPPRRSRRGRGEGRAAEERKPRGFVYDSETQHTRLRSSPSRPRSSQGPRCWEPGQQDFLSPQLPAPLPPRPGRPLPAQVPHSRCTRGPCRGTAALARIALRSQLLPYSAQHDWGGAVSGSGEDERG